MAAEGRILEQEQAGLGELEAGQVHVAINDTAGEVSIRTRAEGVHELGRGDDHWFRFGDDR